MPWSGNRKSSSTVDSDISRPQTLITQLFHENRSKFGGKSALALPSAVLMNPCLELKTVGGEWNALGLPVSSTAIQALEQSLGEDISLGTSLDIDAARVRFSNPQWDAVVNQTAKSIFTSLSLVGSDSSRIAVKPQSLHICTAGSHMWVHICVLTLIY